MEQLKQILESISEDPEMHLEDVVSARKKESACFPCGIERIESMLRAVGCVQELFEGQVEKKPEAPAVEFDGASLTYAELNLRANLVGYYLRKLGVGPEVRVGICMERSLELVIGILGVLKAGGAYVPLDPNYPKEHINYIVSDAGVRLLLTHSSVYASLPPLPKDTRIVLTDDAELNGPTRRIEILSAWPSPKTRRMYCIRQVQRAGLKGS